MIKRTIGYTNPAYLSLQNKQLLVHQPAEPGAVPSNRKADIKASIPIEDIGILVLESQQVTITSGLMAALLDNNCAVITCNDHHMPIGLHLPLVGNQVQNERFRSQLDASLPLRKQLWQQTIQQKIQNQARVLQGRGGEVRGMLRWVDQVRSGDPDNLEGRAAAYYWHNLFLPTISNFTRGQEGDPPNNMLNYGYAILRATVARALVRSGMLPTLGIHHHNRYNAFCLADDIMEPYRPYVDLLVLEIIDQGIDYQELTTDLKRQLLQIPTREVIIDGRRSPLMVAVSQTTASLAKCFDGELRKIIYPVMA